MSTAKYFRYIIRIQYGPRRTNDTSIGNRELGTIPGPPRLATVAAVNMADAPGFPPGPVPGPEP
ncbi:hypothetical protein Hanom_Chr03g00253501 [Helianthus anomalus]